MTRDEEVKYAFAKLHQRMEDALNALMAKDALMAKVDARARAEEREACATVCDGFNSAQAAAIAIRARGQE